MTEIIQRIQHENENKVECKRNKTKKISNQMNVTKIRETEKHNIHPSVYIKLIILVSNRLRSARTKYPKTTKTKHAQITHKFNVIFGLHMYRYTGRQYFTILYKCSWLPSECQRLTSSYTAVNCIAMHRNL